MNKNKKIMTWLTVGALVLTFVSIFMGFLGGWKNGIWKDGKWVTDPVTIQFWKIIFDKKYVVDGFGGESNAGLIITFILTIIAIGGLGAVAALNLTQKANKKLNKGLMISLAVILLVIALLMLCSKAICVVPDENTSLTTGTTIKNVLAAGPITWSCLTAVSGGVMIAAAVLNKKSVDSTKA